MTRQEIDKIKEAIVKGVCEGVKYIHEKRDEPNFNIVDFEIENRINARISMILNSIRAER